ncbi:MAG: DUF1294 domain-containing protein [Clostridia bacterium]|nr:DUF1294 domain-containing protein [Clostridia bacterium]
MKTTILIIIAVAALVMNPVAFVLMGVDKKRARKGAWRIPEKTLFLATACFGGLGGTLGMFLLRHKTKHWYFRLGFPALLVLQVVVVAALIVLL